jgi:hypothetical protein
MITNIKNHLIDTEILNKIHQIFFSLYKLNIYVILIKEYLFLLQKNHFLLNYNCICIYFQKNL